MDAWTPAELDALYREAVVLADRARGWFDGPGVAWREALPARARAAAATEGLATTARLVAIIAWALDRRHTVADGPLPVMAFSPGVNFADTGALGDSPGDGIAAASRRLAARIAARATPPDAEILRHARHKGTIWRR
jgi:hypothetical protein